MIAERTIELVIEEEGSRGIPHRQKFIITVGPNGAEIRRGNDPVVSRDTSALAYIGIEPNCSTLVLHVEERP